MQQSCVQYKIPYNLEYSNILYDMILIIPAARIYCKAQFQIQPYLIHTLDANQGHYQCSEYYYCIIILRYVEIGVAKEKSGRLGFTIYSTCVPVTTWTRQEFREHEILNDITRLQFEGKLPRVVEETLWFDNIKSGREHLLCQNKQTNI